MAALVHDRSGGDLGGDGPMDSEEDRPALAATKGSPTPLRGQAAPPWPAARARHPSPSSRAPMVAAGVVAGLLVLGGAVVDSVAGLAGASAAGGGRPPVPATSLPAAPTEGVVHVVAPGETYWSLAEALGGTGDIRDRVDALQEANGGRTLQAGDRIVLTVVE